MAGGKKGKLARKSRAMSNVHVMMPAGREMGVRVGVGKSWAHCRAAGKEGKDQDCTNMSGEGSTASSS